MTSIIVLNLNGSYYVAVPYICLYNFIIGKQMFYLRTLFLRGVGAGDDFTIDLDLQQQTTKLWNKFVTYQFCNIYEIVLFYQHLFSKHLHFSVLKVKKPLYILHNSTWNISRMIYDLWNLKFQQFRNSS